MSSLSKLINCEYYGTIFLFYARATRRPSTVHIERNNLAVFMTKVLSFHLLIIPSFVLILLLVPTFSPATQFAM